jgi:hypothetical protein
VGVRGLIGAAVAVVALAACTPAAAGRPASIPSGATPSVAPTPSGHLGPPPPAAYAGGACLLLDYKEIKATLGVDFNVSAAADTSGTYSCVVQNSDAELPDLVLSITATDLSAAEFTKDVQPAKAKAVPKLGLVGYEIPVAAASGAGPGVEVGWLSGNNRLMVLRYICPPGTPAADVTALLAKMADLAHQVDSTSV